MKHRLSLATLVITCLLLPPLMSGCATSRAGGTYSRSQTRQEMTVRMGKVESVRAVTIEGTRSVVGPAAGAAIGGIAGSNVGAGRGSQVGAITGAVIGGIAGSAIEEQATKKKGVEVTVRLDSGQLLAIVQEEDDEMFRPGDRVRVLSGGGATRVSH
ncbi:MAG: hypothetical protein AMXMBFR6_16470 [Betaproteobacteria bacterium]|nr:glycine zipper 2TM domain-containing protein [Rhodocyclaceae bacterium]